MPYKKGESGNLKGKPKGSRDKFRPDVAKMFREWDFNPLLELQKIYKATPNDLVKARCCTELAKYFAPQLRSIELSADERALFKFTVNIDHKNIDEAK